MTELHLHLDGSIRPETAYELSRSLNIIDEQITFTQFCDRLIVPPNCTSLNDYLQRFDIPLQLVQDREALIRMTRELVIDLADEGVDHAEIRFAPHSSIGRGLSQRDACDAVLQGVEEGIQARPSIDIGIILCMMRGIGYNENLETVYIASEYHSTRIRAIDLAGAEAIFPTEDYLPLFREAERLGVPFTIHAGEASGPDSIRAALSVGTKRIGHGVRAIEDPELVKYLAENKIILEVCLTSNHQTCICEKLSEHPARQLFDAGVHITFSTDNRTLSDTTLRKELEIAARELGFSESELKLTEQWAREALFSNN